MNRKIILSLATTFVMVLSVTAVLYMGQPGTEPQGAPSADMADLNLPDELGAPSLGSVPVVLEEHQSATGDEGCGEPEADEQPTADCDDEVEVPDAGCGQDDDLGDDDVPTEDEPEQDDEDKTGCDGDDDQPDVREHRGCHDQEGRDRSDRGGHHDLCGERGDHHHQPGHRDRQCDGHGPGYRSGPGPRR
ncbi:MAG: hypothetical protein ISF22_04010 [Methanomassiliicoccus sp.]|nr:hypothetical protein [Methanomassiliicoccus sp.]